MELRTLRALVEVVRQGGFSQAGKVLFATQSTVSKAVKQLEDELQLQLLDRRGPRSALTAAGEIVYRRALTMLAERDDLSAELEELRGLKRGSLRVGFPPVGTSSLFAPMFAAFRKRYPGIDVRFAVHGSTRLEELLLAGEIDLAALVLPVEHEFELLEVSVEPLLALVPRDHAIAGKKKTDLARLSGSPFILFEEGFALNRIILQACQRRGFQPSIAARSGQIDFIIELVAAGFGVSFLPRALAERRRHPSVRHVLLDEPRVRWHIALGWRRAGYMSHAARAWLDLAREIYGGA